MHFVAVFGGFSNIFRKKCKKYCHFVCTDKNNNIPLRHT